MIYFLTGTSASFRLYGHETHRRWTRSGCPTRGQAPVQRGDTAGALALRPGAFHQPVKVCVTAPHAAKRATMRSVPPGALVRRLNAEAISPPAPLHCAKELGEAQGLAGSTSTAVPATSSRAHPARPWRSSRREAFRSNSRRRPTHRVQDWPLSEAPTGATPCSAAWPRGRGEDSGLPGPNGVPPRPPGSTCGASSSPWQGPFTARRFCQVTAASRRAAHPRAWSSAVGTLPASG